MTGRPSSLTMMTGTCWFIPRASTCSTITDVAFMKRDHKSAGITPPTNVSLRTTGVTKSILRRPSSLTNTLTPCLAHNSQILIGMNAMHCEAVVQVHCRSREPSVTVYSIRHPMPVHWALDSGLPMKPVSRAQNDSFLLFASFSHCHPCR